MIALAGTLFFSMYTANAMAQNRAHADLKDGAGKNIGSAVLSKRGNGVLITVNVKGLPQGLHAVHVHAVGKCDGPAFTSAGGHFNPLSKKHGFKNADGPHAGDLPDMYVNKDGVGRYEALMESITLASGETSIFDADGTTIVIHVTADGNSGDRMRNYQRRGEGNVRRECRINLKARTSPLPCRRMVEPAPDQRLS